MNVCEYVEGLGQGALQVYVCVCVCVSQEAEKRESNTEAGEE